jgi:colicin import membrane protein
MATAAQLDLAPSPGTDIVVAVANEPGIVLLDRVKFDAWYEKLAAKAPTDVDVTTKKGRDALRSFAAEVRSEKAAIDKARLRLTKEWRDMVSQANDAGKEIAERLEQLAIEVRKPLTEWEEAETARVNRCREIIDGFKADAVVTLDDTAATVRARGAGIWQIALDEEQFRDLLPEAQSAKEQAVATLKTALARLEKEEADRAELERLRAENEAREAREREEAAERERVEAERRAEEERIAREAEEARLAEERRVAAEKAETERIERARQEAAEAERQRVEREHAEQLAAERRRAEEAERAAQAERDRIAAAEAAREAEAKRLADEQAAREADQAHRSAVMKAAKEAIMTCGVDEETARKVVLLIRAGEVPHVTLGF